MVTHALLKKVVNGLVADHTEPTGVAVTVEDGSADGEELPEKAHMALDYGGMHPNPEEHL
jgi:hypothetical protein